MKMLSGNLKFIIIGIILGIGLVVFDVPTTFENMMNLFMGSFAIILFYYMYKIAHVNNELKKYLLDSTYSLDKIEKKLNRMENNGIKVSLLVNLSVAYSIKKDYKNGLRILGNIDIRKLSGKTKVVYYNNLAFFLFKSGKVLEASKIINENEQLFNKYLTNIQLAPSLSDTIEQIKEATNNKKD